MASKSRKTPRLRTGDGAWFEAVRDALEYSFHPIDLPRYTISPVKFTSIIASAIDQHLGDAFSSGLPDGTLGVQFVYATRPVDQAGAPVALGLEHPLIFRARGHEAGSLVAALAHVTEILRHKRSPSFHYRIRQHELVDAPAVCIFSASPWRGATLRMRGMNVIHVRLSPLQVPGVDVHAAFQNLIHAAGGERHLRRVDLLKVIESAEYQDLVFPEIQRPFEIEAQIVCAAHEDPVRRRRLARLTSEIRKDYGYCERVRYLVSVGDVILCTPHAYNRVANETGEANSFSEQVADAGLTVVLKRPRGIGEADWLRVQTVAQMLAVFSGAALSTADRARVHINRYMSASVQHEFANTSAAIYHRLGALARSRRVVTEADVEDLSGRLRLTRELMSAAMLLDEQGVEEARELLGRALEPLESYADVKLTSRVEIGVGAKISCMWAVVVCEAVRNAYKHSDRKQQPVQLECVAIQSDVQIVVNIANHDGGGVRGDSEGMRLIQTIALELGGSFVLKRGDPTIATIVMPIVA